MSFLKEIYQYKTALLPLLFNSEEIVRTIDNKDIDPDSPDELIYKSLYPFLFIPETQDKVATYICFDLFVTDVKDNLLKTVELHFYIFSHQDHMRTQFGYSRIDYIQHQIDKILNGSTIIGIDNIQLKKSIPLLFGTMPYRGKELIYTVLNLNQDRCGGWDKV